MYPQNDLNQYQPKPSSNDWLTLAAILNCVDLRCHTVTNVHPTLPTFLPTFLVLAAFTLTVKRWLWCCWSWAGCVKVCVLSDSSPDAQQSSDVWRLELKCVLVLTNLSSINVEQQMGRGQGAVPQTLQTWCCGMRRLQEQWAPLPPPSWMPPLHVWKCPCSESHLLPAPWAWGSSNNR